MLSFSALPPFALFLRVFCFCSSVCQSQSLFLVRSRPPLLPRKVDDDEVVHQGWLVAGAAGGEGGGRGAWTAKTVKRPPQQPAHPQYANYWALLTPCHIQHSPNTPTTGLCERGNDTSKSTGASSRQNAATRCNMRREERVTVQGPVKEQQPDGMSHGGESATAELQGPFANPNPQCLAYHRISRHTTAVQKSIQMVCVSGTGGRAGQSRGDLPDRDEPSAGNLRRM